MLRKRGLMLKNLKKSVLENKESIKFLSDFDLYGSYEDLVEALMGSKVVVLDQFDYDHRDLNKRFVDLSVEAGVEKVYYLKKFADDSIMNEEQSQLEKYIKDYPGLDASFIQLPLSMESVYKKIMKHEKLPRNNFSVMANEDLNKVLKSILLIEDNDKEAYDIKGLSFDDVHLYHASFESNQAFPMNSYKSDLINFDLLTWYEFLQNKKRA